MGLEFKRQGCHPLLHTIDRWAATAGYFSFLILQDTAHPARTYFTSYRDVRHPVDILHPQAIQFGPPDGVDQAKKPVGGKDDTTGWETYTQAEAACKKKYKELLARR